MCPFACMLVCVYASVQQVFNKGKMFTLLSTLTTRTQKASKFHSMTLRGCGWLHQSSIPSSLPPVLMRNRTRQPWLNLPSVCVCFFYACVCAHTHMHMIAGTVVCLCICKHVLVLCKVAPWCQTTYLWRLCLMFDLVVIRLPPSPVAGPLIFGEINSYSKDE